MKTIIKPLIIILMPLILLSGIVLVKNRYYVNHDIRFLYPWKHSLFPREFAPPSFFWTDKATNVNSWKITVNLAGKPAFYTQNVVTKMWKPGVETWDSIKRFSNYKDIRVIISRNNKGNRSLFKDLAKLTIRISVDEVGAPILYREIPLPFVYAESHISEASYALYNISSTNPRHEALAHFPVCSNCHSFSGDGKTIALDFDAVTRDKGGYFIANIDTQAVFNNDNYISWSKMQGRSTFGLFSKISWKGRYVLTTIKDRVISEKFEASTQMAYSQLFFPVNGVIAIYDRQTKKLSELPGANDTAYVQTNGVWTPDDKYIIFARAKALPYPDKNSEYRSFITDKKIVDDFVHERRSLKYDLYIIPFNDGRGGEPKPIRGASFNGKSNFFPTVSPDGKWLVFCENNNFMMLRRDSKLYIVPVEGGKARELECNFPEMNSWHDWSPNGKWLVYSSKGLSMFTDMFLTHIDENGHASIPVLLEDTKRPDCAVNYPEFINRDPAMTLNMKYEYINTDQIEAAINHGEIKEAKVLLAKYLAQGQTGTPPEYDDLGYIMGKLGNKEESEKYYNLEKQADSSFYRRF